VKATARKPDARLWVVWCCALAMGCQSVSVWRATWGPGLRPAAFRVQPDAGRVMPGQSPNGLLEAARASHAASRSAQNASKDLAARYELEAIAHAAAAMAVLPPASGADHAAADPWAVESRDLYNVALEDLLRLTGGRKIRLNDGWREHLAALGIGLAEPGQEGVAVWDAGRFDYLLFARDFVVRGLEDQYHTEGVGVPMIAVRRFEPNKREREQGQDRFLTPREVYPVTALLQVMPTAGVDALAASPRQYRLEFRDPLATRQVNLMDHTLPLASDLTTPLAYHLARTPLPVLQEVGLLDPGWLDPLKGLSMLHPYRPGKIPIVFVHGLRSSPEAWLEIINEIWGDPVLRERFQVWLYMYPSGEPLPTTASQLRQDLDELRQVVDPGHADPMLDRMVVIGHSMGGLIAKMMIAESGDALWRLFSNRPFEELRASPDRRERLRRSFFFHPNPSIARIVFIATPHRGSELGDELIGRITDRLIRLPWTLRSTYRALVTSNGPGFFTPMLRDGIPSSIDELRLDNPFLLTLAGLPRRTDVPVHSIIGWKDLDEPLEESSDGVVPYTSAHIDWAQSELIVHGNHMSLALPETLAEIRRILLLHLDETPPTLR
jgi:pimeloyl-ACP methyl ester carboxylesterase